MQIDRKYFLTNCKNGSSRQIVDFPQNQITGYLCGVDPKPAFSVSVPRHAYASAVSGGSTFFSGIVVFGRAILREYIS